MKNYVLLTLVTFLMGLSSCKKEEVDSDQLIKDYLEENNLEAEKTEDGLYYIITREGPGEKADLSSTVEVNYKGYLLNGDIFDSSYDRGKSSSFPLTGVIQGWQIGIPKLRVGGAGTLLVPHELGYGSNPPRNSIIGVDEVLLFDIELLDVQ
ncbi:MAG: FKBP-type peptidyl-prolyl cis-trans isomerase [Bacteroidia bacterium]